jgi:outer membrane lipoprotein SlyB
MRHPLSPIRLALLGVLATVAGCAPDYSPDTYATRAVQQANKVEQGVIVGARPVAVTADGSVGAVTGAAAGGVAGSQAPGGVGSAFGAIGGSLVGGLVGTAVEHGTGDTTATEYIVRKSNGEMLSVTQKDPTPLPIGQKVLVIAGAQARVVADYTVPVPDKSAPDKSAEHAARPQGDLSAGQAQPNTAGAVPPPAPVAAASLPAPPAPAPAATSTP